MCLYLGIHHFKNCESEIDVLTLTDLALLTDEMVEVPSVDPVFVIRSAPAGRRCLYGFWPCTHTAGYNPHAYFTP